MVRIWKSWVDQLEMGGWPAPGLRLARWIYCHEVVQVLHLLLPVSSLCFLDYTFSSLLHPRTPPFTQLGCNGATVSAHMLSFSLFFDQDSPLRYRSP